MSNKIEIIGCMDHTLDHTFESANRVYSPQGIAPTIPTSCGGGHTPKIIEAIPMNAITTRGSDIASTIRASYYKNGERNVIENMESGKGYEGVIEYKCVAMRGRDDGQQFEIRDEDVVNTITTVNKDCMIMEKQTVPLRMVRTEEGKALRKQYETHEIHHGFNEYRELEPKTDGVCNTISTVQKDNYMLEEIKIKQATKDGSIPIDVSGGGAVCSLDYPNSKTRRGRVIENGNVCPTLTTESIPSVLEEWIWEIDGVTYLIRIRKLTPRECWNLMSFKDKDFEAAESVNSNTQLYKEAGNSIVKNCLMAIFSQLNIEGLTPWNDLTEEERYERLAE